MKDDDFEVNLLDDAGEDAAPAKDAADPAAPRRAGGLFDWEKQDPQDFSGAAAQPAEEDVFDQPLFVQDSFGKEPRAESAAAPQGAASAQSGDPASAAQAPAAARPTAPFDIPLDDPTPAAPQAAQTSAPAGAQPGVFSGWPFDAAAGAPQNPAPQNSAAASFAIPIEDPQPAPAPQSPAPAAPACSPAPAAAAGASVLPVPARLPANGHTVLISGGDRGIGAAAARLFWQQGYHTAILYYQNEAAARTLINALGSDCMAVHCDVADRAECEAALAAVRRTFGDPDVLVCNAGIAQQKLFTEITPAEWQRMLDVDLSGAFHLCQLVLPAMIRRRYGRILTVSSMWGQTGGSCEVHYSAAKAGLIGLTKALAKEEGPSGITVNCVAPGVIDTDMMAAFSAQDKAQLAEETPVGRLGTAQEAAQALVFLAQENAGYITGQVLGVNGGLVI